MDTFLKPEEVGSLLKVDPSEVISLIKEGDLRAYKIGSQYRIGQTDLEDFLMRCPTSLSKPGPERHVPKATTSNHVRKCRTFAGHAEFRISGTVANGAEIWPGKMQYPIRFPQEFLQRMLKHFRGREVKVGMQFDRPDAGSLGAWIQENLPTMMNPATYVAGLLVDEGYAERSGRGMIRFFAQRKS